jgi:hypothetical protein
MRPVRGQATLGQDQHQRAESQNLRQPGIVKPHPQPGLTQRQAKTEENQQRREPGSVRQPGRNDRGDHHTRRGQQDEAEVTCRHGRLRIARSKIRCC